MDGSSKKSDFWSYTVIQNSYGINIDLLIALTAKFWIFKFNRIPYPLSYAEKNLGHVNSQVKTFTRYPTGKLRKAW